MPSIAETTDNLKYDCGRVNVIIGIDKTKTPHVPVQYFQDHSFRLSPQGNIVWNNTFQPDEGTIYTVHYESVIQYRAISAMHINRFAQVPDRSTGKVAQVNLPEQWIYKKNFLLLDVINTVMRLAIPVFTVILLLLNLLILLRLKIEFSNLIPSTSPFKTSRTKSTSTTFCIFIY